VRIAVDTNVLVRYLTWDDEGQAIEAANAIEGADAIVVPTIVLCELVWVLKRAYHYAGPEIIDILRRLVAIRAVEIERPAAEAGIAMLARGGDFADGVVRQRPTVPNAIASSHSTRASPDCSIPTRSRFWAPGPYRNQSVAGRVDDAAGMLADLGVDKFAAMCLEAFELPPPRRHPSGASSPDVGG
jgi:predicted nucleic-acid-binding protein